MPTEDGWEPSPRIDPNSPLLVWRTVPGSDVNLQVRNDHAGTAMLAYAADYHAYVEPLVDRMTACYTPTNSVSTSNHLNATAMDFNWEYYPWKRRGNLNGAKLARLRELLDYWRGIMFWAGDWDDAYVDEMHHQMDYGSYDLERSGQLGQWVKDHIRPDGFSTFRRSESPPPPPVPTQLSKKDQYALATINEGKRLGITPKGIKIAIAVELVETNLTMYANRNVPGSEDRPHEKVGSDHDSTGLFQQRQAWGPLSETMDPTLSARLFFTGGHAGQRGLTDFDYNSDARTPGGWAQAVQVSAFPDRYDARYGEAEQIYNRLATAVPPPQGDDMAQVPQEQWDRVYRELTQRLPSRSPLRHLGEGVVDTMAGFILNIDGSQHVQIVQRLAGYGDPEALALLREVAGADPGKYPDRQHDAQLAQAILADTTSKPAPTAVNNAPASNTRELADAHAEIARLNARLEMAENAPTPYVRAPALEVASAGSTGQVIGRAFDALQELRLADALPIEDRAPLAALISVLQTKNGSELK